MKNSHKLIVLDLDDTLIDCSKMALIKTRYLAEKFGYKFDEDRFWELFGKVSFESCITTLFPGIDLERYKTEYEQLKYGEFPYQTLIDVDELLDRLFQSGYDVGIVTNESGEKCSQKLKTAVKREEIRKRLKFVLDIDSLGGKKSDELAIERFRKIIGTDYEEVTFIGDSVSDYIFATRAKIGFVGVLSGVDTKENFMNAGVQGKLFASISEFADSIM